MLCEKSLSAAVTFEVSYEQMFVRKISKKKGITNPFKGLRKTRCNLKFFFLQN